MSRIASQIKFNITDSQLFDGQDFVEKIIAVRVREIDEFILRWLYETYKSQKISTIYVLSKEEFKRFLQKYLPIYEEELEE